MIVQPPTTTVAISERASLAERVHVTARPKEPTTDHVVEVPDPDSGRDSEDFAIFLKRSDGAEVKVLDDFFLAIL